MRIGINVPNDLLNRVKFLQPEVNVSQVCREALTKLADNHKLALERVGSDGTVERVIGFVDDEDLPLLEPDWVGYALDDARDWVSKVTPEGWDIFLDMYDFLERKGRTDFEVLASRCYAPKGVKTFHHRESENEEWFLQMADYVWDNDLDCNVHQEAEKAYATAWLSYLDEVRRQYFAYRKAKCEKALAEWEQEKAEAMRSRPAPELPPQLRE